MDLNVNKGEYAWKPQVIEEVVRDYGGLVLWMDSGDRIRETLGVEFWEDVATSGIWSTNSGGEIWQWTHPGMFARLDVPESLWKSQNCNAANVGLNSQNARAMVKVVRPVSLLGHIKMGTDRCQWFACSAEKDCIAPPGSSRANHRQDQAALSSFVYLHGYHCLHHAPIDTQQDDPGEEQ